MEIENINKDNVWEFYKELGNTFFRKFSKEIQPMVTGIPMDDIAAINLKIPIHTRLIKPGGPSFISRNDLDKEFKIGFQEVIEGETEYDEEYMENDYEITSYLIYPDIISWLEDEVDGIKILKIDHYFLTIELLASYNRKRVILGIFNVLGEFFKQALEDEYKLQYEEEAEKCSTEELINSFNKFWQNQDAFEKYYTEEWLKRKKEIDARDDKNKNKE